MRGPETGRVGRARALRKEPTAAELRLWSAIRNRSLQGFKFVRQEPIGPYVADFVCREHRLVIEVDGGQHATDTKDPIRERYLMDQGYRVLRFWNNDVLANLPGVLETIVAALRASAPHPDR